MTRAAHIVLKLLFVTCVALHGQFAHGAPSDAMSDVAFTPPGGVFTNAVSLKLSGTAGEIRYTLDGSTPALSSPAFVYPRIRYNHHQGEGVQIWLYVERGSDDNVRCRCRWRDRDAGRRTGGGQVRDEANRHDLWAIRRNTAVHHRRERSDHVVDEHHIR